MDYSIQVMNLGYDFTILTKANYGSLPRNMLLDCLHDLGYSNFKENVILFEDCSLESGTDRFSTASSQSSLFDDDS